MEHTHGCYQETATSPEIGRDCRLMNNPDKKNIWRWITKSIINRDAVAWMLGGGCVLCRQKWNGGRSESLPTSSDTVLCRNRRLCSCPCRIYMFAMSALQLRPSTRPCRPSSSTPDMQKKQKNAVWTRVYWQEKVFSSLLCCFGIFRTLTMVVTAQDIHTYVSFESIMIEAAVLVLVFLTGWCVNRNLNSILHSGTYS